MSFIETVCPRDCYDTCAINVSVRDGKLVRTMGNRTSGVTQGFLCPRGYKDIERVYSDQRILYPHYKTSKEHKRISWEKALTTITDKLQHVLDNDGPESCLQLCCMGNQGLFTSYLPQRLFYALGFTQTDESICSKSGHDALSLHYGSSYGIDPDELLHKELTVYWGFNAAVSAMHLYRLSQKAQKNGGTIVCVDPRKSETAESADVWIQPQPGSDVALAYGVLKYLIENDFIDHDFIEEYTYGFSQLKAEVSTRSVQAIEECTGISWDTVSTLGDLYGHCRENVTMIGIGMQKNLYGAEAVRAVSLIPAVLGLHRGFYYSNFYKWPIDYPYITGKSLTDHQVNVISQVGAGRLLEKGTFKFVYIHNMNPAQTLPNQKAVIDGLNRDDVHVVVHDTHWTETARLADIVLPAPTFFEKEDIVIPYSHSYMRKCSRIIPPRGESRSELWVITQLAEKLHFTQKWIYEDCWKAMNTLKNALASGTLSDLKKGNPVTLKKRLLSHYQTPTKKIELYSTRAEERGVTPLPRYYSLPGNGFILLNSAMKNYTHTQFQDVYGAIPSLVFINLEDALDHKIKDTDIIELHNEWGSIRLKAVISVSVPRGVLWTPRQGKDVRGTPQNTIIPDTTQKIGGGPIFNSTQVRIRTLDP